MDKSILCAGAIVHDTLVLTDDDSGWGTNTLVDSIESYVGGNAATTSMALARLGSSVRVIGWTGDDAHGRFVRSQLEESGVDLRYVVSGEGPTAATVGLVRRDGQRRFLHRPGVSREAFPVSFNLEDVWAPDVHHLHLCSLYILQQLRSHAPALLRQAKEKGLSVSLDTNWDPLGRWLTDLEPCLPFVDYLLMNEDEMHMLTGTAEPEIGAAFMRERGVSTVVIKLGANGSYLLTADQEGRCRAFTVKVVDTTGAGDCFTAGFLDATLRGESLKDALRFANASGAWSVQQSGGIGSLRSRHQIESWLTTQAVQA